MSIFISHSFSDKDQFDNIADALERKGIAYWSPSDILPGAMLSDQLKNAISKSEICIFIATQHSVDSAWCNAELGAFWGAGKRVLIFVADSSLGDSSLPRQFHGHFLERRISKLVDASEKYLEQIGASENASEGELELERGSGFSKEELSQLVEATFDRSNNRSLAATAFRQLGNRLSGNAQEPVFDLDRKALQSSLLSFLGLSRASIEETAPQDWPHRVLTITTTTGTWEGYAQNETLRSYNYIMTPCILFRYDEKHRVVATAAFSQSVELDRGGIGVSELLAIAGERQVWRNRAMIMRCRAGPNPSLHRTAFASR